MRFYEIDKGSISLDGHDTRLMRRDDLRRTFAWSSELAVRRHDTRQHRPTAAATPPEEIVAAAKGPRGPLRAELPDGYDTVIDDDARTCRQGEKQLLTIARAFLADPQILILDEARAPWTPEPKCWSSRRWPG